MKYTFGTSDAAAARLEEIAGFFNPLALQFIRRYATAPVGSAVDLGCGPGFTTDMLAEATQCENVYGLDKSDHFLKMAAERFPHCTFMEHDVRENPFPVRADVMYVRFLLSHLKEVVELVNTWIPELNRSGVLLIEELETVHTDPEVFNTYLSMSEGIVASQGASLYVGPILAEGEYVADALCNECVTIPVSNSQAATWFLPNASTIWEENEYVLARLSQSERESVREELTRLRERDDGQSDITWYMRRLVLRRRAS